MSASPPNLSLVVPAFNEGPNVTPVVREIVETVGRHPWVGPYEIVLINDGSRDDTGAVMDALARQYPSVKVVHHEVNRGFGAALKSGFAATTGNAVSMVTADGEVAVDQVLAIYRELGDADLILSIRERPVVSLVRRLLTIGIDWTIWLILGVRTNKKFGIYVVNGPLLRSMPLYSDSGLVNLEVVLNCREGGRQIREARTAQVTRTRLSGESKVANLRTIIFTLNEMFRLRLRRRQGRRQASR